MTTVVVGHVLGPILGPVLGLAGAGPTPTTPLYPAGTALLPVDIQSGATLALSWLTDVRRAWDGTEQRVALRSKPQISITFPIYLTDTTTRSLLGLLSRYAHTAPMFRIALPHEALTVASSSGTTITTHGLSLCDWAVAGSRVVVEGPTGTGESIVASASSPDLVTDDDLSAVATVGARIMPTLPVYLEPVQDFARHLVNVGQVSVTAHAATSEYAGGAWGTGASVTSHDGLPVWTWGVQSEGGPLGQPVDSGHSLIRAGLKVGALANLARGQGTRTLLIESHRQADWQWLKLLLDTVRGRWKAFLAPTGRPDLPFTGDASGGSLTVVGLDYVNAWYPSLAHRRVRLVFADGSVAYRTITAAADNGDGTQTLALASAAAGTLARVEFLELVRLEADEVSVRWDGAVFAAELEARVVQG